MFISVYIKWSFCSGALSFPLDLAGLLPLPATPDASLRSTTIVLGEIDALALGVHCTLWPMPVCAPERVRSEMTIVFGTLTDGKALQ